MYHYLPLYSNILTKFLLKGMNLLTKAWVLFPLILISRNFSSSSFSVQVRILYPLSSPLTLSIGTGLQLNSADVGDLT